MTSAILEKRNAISDLSFLRPTSNLLRLQKNEKIKDILARSSPICKEYADNQGNKLRLWTDIKKNNFYGTIVHQNGNIRFISIDKLVNPLNNNSPLQALQNIRKSQNLDLDLVYLESSQQIVIWPRLIAAMKDDITDWLQPTFPDDKSTIGHIFRKKEGHFQYDSPENRAYILTAVDSPANKIVTVTSDGRYLREIYLKMMPDGTQAWADVYNGIITNGGCNEVPKKWVIDSTNQLGGKLVSLTIGELEDSSNEVKERIKANRLEDPCNTDHSSELMPVPTMELRGIKRVRGVGNTTGFITNLIDELKTTEQTEHFFFIPSPEQGFFSSPSEIQQVMRDVARGIYIYDAIPFISIHFNQEIQQYSVIHPAYQNTYTGYVMGMLDYYMKGFYHGYFFDEAFIQNWNKDPITDEKYLRQNCLAFREYCKTHLGEACLTFHEILAGLQKQVSGQAGNNVLLKNELNISFRIVGKQNSIRKSNNLFMLNGDFDVFYMLGSKPSNKEEEAHFALIEEACEVMCLQIKQMLPRLPNCRKLVEALNIMNFFAYYFNSLQEAKKIPSFDRSFFPKEHKTCTVLFPPIPESEASKIRFKPASLFKQLSQGQLTAFTNYMSAKQLVKSYEEAATNILQEALKAYITKKYPANDLTSSDYYTLAIAFLPACRGRYQATQRSVEANLNAMGINPYQASQMVLLGLDQVLQRINNDIAKLENIINSQNRRGFSFIDKTKFHKDLQENKNDVTIYKPFLQNWFQNPIKIIFSDAIITLNLVTKTLSVNKEAASDKVQVGGGCGIRLQDMVAEEDSQAELLVRNHPFISALPREAIFPISANPVLGMPSGVLFKLPFKEFYIAGGNRRQSAVGCLCPSPPEYPMSMPAALIFHAIATKDETLFRKTADEIQDWNFKNSLGISFMHYAAVSSNPFFLQELIRKKANPNITDSHGFTPLHYAARKGNILGLQLLISSVPEMINAQSITGETALYLAVQNNQKECVRIFLKEKAQAHIKPIHGMNALMSAIFNGYEELAVELLNAKIFDVNYSLPGGKNALLYVIERKMKRALQALIDQGVHINNLLHLGYRPLHLAVVQEWLDGVKILAATPDIKFDALALGVTALDIAIENNQREIVSLLQQKKIGFPNPTEVKKSNIGVKQVQIPTEMVPQNLGTADPFIDFLKTQSGAETIEVIYGIAGITIFFTSDIPEFPLIEKAAHAQIGKKLSAFVFTNQYRQGLTILPNNLLKFMELFRVPQSTQNFVERRCRYN